MEVRSTLCENSLTVLDSLIRTIGAASTVLLKNTNNVLPLVKPLSIGVVGNGAGNSSKGPNGYVRTIIWKTAA